MSKIHQTQALCTFFNKRMHLLSSLRVWFGFQVSFKQIEVKTVTTANMSVFTTSVWFFQLFHPIPMSAIYKEKFPLQHICFSVQDVGINQASMIHQYPLEGVHVDVTTLKNTKKIFRSLVLQHKLKP